MRPYINAYDRAIDQIRDDIRELGALVNERLSEALTCVAEMDVARGRKLILGDEEIDLRDEAIERAALELISWQQPMVEELRFLTASIRVSRDLERIADYASDIAKAVMHIEEPTVLSPPDDVIQMGGLVGDMLRSALNGYLTGDLAFALNMDEKDDEVDQGYDILAERLMGRIRQFPDKASYWCQILLVGRYLERMADHVVNISEMTIFVRTGERHPFKVRKQGETHEHR